MSKHTIDSIEIPREYRSQISIQPQNSRKFTYNPKAMTNDEGTSLIYVYTNKIRLRSYVGSHFMFYYYPEQDTLYVYDHGISYKPIPPIKPEKFHVFLDTEHIDSCEIVSKCLKNKIKWKGSCVKLTFEYDCIYNQKEFALLYKNQKEIVPIDNNDLWDWRVEYSIIDLDGKFNVKNAMY